MHYSSSQWYMQYIGAKAIWVHNGQENRPHAVITGGRHTNTVFNSDLVLQDPVFLDRAAADLLELLLARGMSVEAPSRVVGPSMGSITLAHDLARHISLKRPGRCYSGYTQKDSFGIVSFQRMQIRHSEVVLAVEDVVTTGNSVLSTLTAASAACAYSAPFITAIVNRSGLKKIDGKEIVSLIDSDSPTWSPDECPLCKLGSEAILKPKSLRSWEKLMVL